MQSDYLHNILCYPAKSLPTIVYIYLNALLCVPGFSQHGSVGHRPPHALAPLKMAHRNAAPILALRSAGGGGETGHVGGRGGVVN